MNDARHPDSPVVRLAQADAFELDLLTVLALLHTAARSSWRSRAAELGLSPEPNRKLTRNEQLEPALQEYLARGLIFEPSPGYFSMSPTTALAVLQASHARGRLETLSLQPAARERRGPYNVSSRDWPWETQVRLALVFGRHQALGRTLQSTHASPSLLGEMMLSTLGFDPERAWLEMLPEGPRNAYLQALFEQAILALRPAGAAACEAATQTTDRQVRMQRARYQALRGERHAGGDPVDDRTAVLGPLPKWGAEGLAVIRAFCSGDYAKAARYGDAAVDAMTKRKRKLPGLEGLEGVFHALATVAMTSDDPRYIERLGRLIESSAGRKNIDSLEYHTLSYVYRSLRKGGHDPGVLLLIELQHPPEQWTSVLVTGLTLAWLGQNDRKRRDAWVDLLRFHAQEAEVFGSPGLARELHAVGAVLAREDGPRGLVHQYSPPAPWEAALASLEAIASEVNPTEPSPAQRELVWELETSGLHVQLQPRLRDPRGRAKKGTKVSASTMLRDSTDASMLAGDHQILNALAEGAPLAARSALSKLVGHPRVVDGNGEAVTVEAGRPVIRTSVHKGKIEMRIEPAELTRWPVAFQWPEPRRIVVYARSPEFERFSRVLARQPEAIIPAREQARLQRALLHVAVASGADLEGALAVEAPTEPADPRLVLVMTRSGDALTIRARVAPFGVEGPHFLPGQGASTVMAEVAGQSLARRDRNLESERNHLATLIERCPRMAELQHAELEWVAPGLADALDVMVELAELGDTVFLAWPDGKPLRPPEYADTSAFGLSVMDADAWLSVEGTLAVDDALVLTFEQLLAARLGDRYVALSRDRFLALSSDLRQRLEALESLGELQGESLRLSTATLPVLESLAEGLEHATFDDKSKARLQALMQTEQKTPRLPKGFRAKLRDYQREGFTWLWRRAEAGLGACLADDMGLGKTIQTLALLVERASKGPAVVFCPTSVLLNWEQEAERFAPGLHGVLLGSASDRAELLASLGPGDLLICSYGLLTQESELLSDAHFATAVFDEAHALKNAESQRAQAARDIHAGMRIALTGTPIENNLGELWSLFDVLIPGLLGSKTLFDKRFTGPIARGHKERAEQLRTVLRHFVLRRTKNQVLTELPPRTELNLNVEMPPAAQAFYEALRQRALETVSKAKGAHKRIQLFAELTRLRQAAIDPRLVDPDHGPAGRKLDVLLAQLESLRDEGHHALVFTQFLGSMALVRERLDQANLRYTFFDGSTSASERARRIEAFQAGDFDVFLLSLRAGGIGINLTGADYVFHLDPWWNPAVEDQATDRAHRLGQTRPVTVYRLISSGTIEEKILLLHEAKRGLADDLLGDLEGSSRLDFDALLELLRA